MVVGGGRMTIVAAVGGDYRRQAAVAGAGKGRRVLPKTEQTGEAEEAGQCTVTAAGRWRA